MCKTEKYIKTAKRRQLQNSCDFVLMMPRIMPEKPTLTFLAQHIINSNYTTNSKSAESKA